MASSPQTGHVKTDGSFFFTTFITLLLRLPKLYHFELTRNIFSTYFNVPYDYAGQDLELKWTSDIRKCRLRSRRGCGSPALGIQMWRV
jgi:hypothetical protein